jgi:hypothetical protein
MPLHLARFAALLVSLSVLVSCERQPPASSETRAPDAAAPQPPVADPELQENVPPLAAAEAAEPAAPAPSNATGCAPGARCIAVTGTGRPQPSGASIAQCRGNFADFIVPANTIPAGYDGPWFAPNLIETAHTGVPQSTRPWRAFDPRDVDERLPYVLALRNYAFSSHVVRGLIPDLTADSNYIDPAGGTVPQNQQEQHWYPAPRMIYGNPSSPGSREAAHGMTLERTVRVGELGENTVAFRNYAVAYYDARGARTYARVWSTASPGVDTPNRAHMRFAQDALVFKLLYSAAEPDDFPQDLLEDSLSLEILPNAGGTPVSVRLLQIDIAVKDNRAGPTGWYFATYAYDRSVSGNSPWRKMVPVGLMWGNDPDGPPLEESWINPSAPAYASAHLGVDGRLNGPVDNPASACMSCHSTSQAPSVAPMIPPASGPCAPARANWFRNLPGTDAFGRFDPEGSTCETSIDGVTLTAADYSLQLAATITRAVSTTEASFNPCTWDEASPPLVSVTAEGAEQPAVRIFEVTRDPQE